MAAMVFLDLETNSDRGEVAEHEIIEIGAIRIDQSGRREFQTLVRPTREVSPDVLELTGISAEDLKSAAELGEAIDELRALVGDLPTIAHNGNAYDYPILDAAIEVCGGAQIGRERLDSLDLAHLVYPRAGKNQVPGVDGTVPPRGRSLDLLAEFFAVPLPDDRHRALADCDVTLKVVEALIGAMDSNRDVRRLQRWILAEADHPWSRFLSGVGDPPELAMVIPNALATSKSVPTGRYDIEAVTSMFRAGGVLMGGGRQERQPQVDMTREVAQALADGSAQMIEAPTGTGKTLAYLVPAIEYARASGSSVLVSAHSRVLQSQIHSTILELGEVLEPFSGTVLKGRENYIDLEALEAEIATPPTDEAVSLVLALLVGWVAETPTGDWDDLNAWQIESRESMLPLMKWKLRVDSPPGPASTELDTLDFYRRALEAASQADIVVFNHALLVSRSDWMGSIKHVVIDEAHNLEESATSAMSEDLTFEGLRYILDAIWDDGRRWGTLGRLADAAGQGLGEESISAARIATDDARKAAEAFADPLIGYVRSRSGAQREQVAEYGASYRIRPGVDTARPSYGSVASAARRLRSCLWSVGDALNELIVPAVPRGRYRRDRLEAEISRLGRAVRASAELIDKVMFAVESDVFINIVDLSIGGEGWSWGLRRVPVSVARELVELWETVDSVVLTSATLQVNGSFSHLQRTLGLEAASVKMLGSPFADLPENHLVVLTDHLPPPRGNLMDEFTMAESSEIARLITLASGRTIVLFTARSRMKQVAEHARPPVELFGLPVLVQGEQPSPELVNRLRDEDATSLLAVRSFWEGIDIPGQALSQLVIEKLPFDSPADPIVGARTEAMELEGSDPFSDYIVPRAALRFAQGVGRLIRTEDDVGVTVLLDNRLRRPVPYREQMLGTLVGPPRMALPKSREDAYQAIADHLGIDIDIELEERLASIPSADPWVELDGLLLDEGEASDLALIDERLESVRELFGFDVWRPGQLEAMRAFLLGRDVVAVLPTGSGKSITYQIPALLGPGVTLVVSPLIALMRDQVQNLRARGVTKVAAIHSGIAQGEQQEILRGAQRGQYKLIYVSPERLWSPRFLSQLRHVEIDRVAVDEAHCISQWGHSFRPEYVAIPTALDHIVDGPLPVMAATATATSAVRDEIRERLALRPDAVEIIRSPERPEIRYYTEYCSSFDERDLRVVQVVDAFKGQSAIVYAPRHRDTVRLASVLQAAGHSARQYHGGMETGERLHVEDAFRHGEIDVVVATKAFGLGVDKPDIALIVHLEMPATIEEYVQETGRVARGAALGIGPTSGTCVLISTPRDCNIHRFFVDGSAPDLDTVKGLWNTLNVGANYIELDHGVGGGDHQAKVLAAHYLVESEVVERRPDVAWEGRVWIPADADRLLNDVTDDMRLAQKGRDVLQLVNDLGSYDYSAQRWAQRLRTTPDDLQGALLDLQSRDIIGFSTWVYAWHLHRRAAVEPDWAKIEELAERRRRHMGGLARDARDFARDRGGCRRVSILRYMGVEDDAECVSCDRCRELQRPWADSELTHDSVARSLPAKRICAQLLRDTGGARFSRRNLLRALVGDDGGSGPHPLSLRLVDHPSFGRLALLGETGVEGTLNEMLDSGAITEIEVDLDGLNDYTTLELTEDGRAQYR